MDLNKAIKKQKVSYKRFLRLMSFIFFILPLIFFVAQKFTFFLLSYLIILEMVIILAVFIRSDSESLAYEFSFGKVMIKEGIFRKNYFLNCEKVVLVHPEIIKDEVQLIIITSSKFRNKNIEQVSDEFFIKYNGISAEYLKVKSLFINENFYYIIINKGGYLKCKLLTELYRNCVRAKYSKKAIETIKMWEEG